MLSLSCATLDTAEISTGLDSSTTYEIVKWMADTTHALNNTTLIALLQPAPETFELFDDVILLRCASSEALNPCACCTDPHLCTFSLHAHCLCDTSLSVSMLVMLNLLMLIAPAARGTWCITARWRR